jgi:hypothetical protein
VLLVLLCGLRNDNSSSKLTLELSGKKRAILEALLRQQGIGETKVERIPCRPESGPAPLSFAQQRIWFLDQLEPESPLYNIHTGVELSGPLNVSVLQRSIAEILRRHEALRTTFAVIDDHPVQVINKSAGFKLPVHNLQELDESQRRLRVSAWAEESARQWFDLTTGPLLRANLLRLGETSTYLFDNPSHHFGWMVSGRVCARTGGALRSIRCWTPSPLQELPIQYADFAGWQRSWLQGERLEEQLSYWKANSPMFRRFSNYQPIGHARRCNPTRVLTKLCSYQSPLSRSLKELKPS